MRNRSRVLTLREEALHHVRLEEYDCAIALYDEALAFATDEELRDLVTISKADALLALGGEGVEIQQLPVILLRRRTPLHTFLAAYSLMFRWRLQNDFRRSLSYGETALQAARETGEPMHIVGALNEMGNVYELDSRFDAAVASFEEAMTWVERIPKSEERRLATVAIVRNMGYSRIQAGDPARGVDMVLSVLDEVPPSALSDAHLDVSIGCLALGDHARALSHANRALQLATDPRETRNAHYLLGEISCRVGDNDAAEAHFLELAAYYPSFRNLTDVLLAIDLIPLVNFRV